MVPAKIMICCKVETKIIADCEVVMVNFCREMLVFCWCILVDLYVFIGGFVGLSVASHYDLND